MDELLTCEKKLSWNVEHLAVRLNSRSEVPWTVHWNVRNGNVCVEGPRANSFGVRMRVNKPRRTCDYDLIRETFLKQLDCIVLIMLILLYPD